MNDEAEAMTGVLDKVMGPMPIYATRIGFRTDSTDHERRLGDFLFKIARDWEDFKASESVATSSSAVPGDD